MFEQFGEFPGWGWTLVIGGMIVLQKNLEMVKRNFYIREYIRLNETFNPTLIGFEEPFRYDIGEPTNWSMCYIDPILSPSSASPVLCD